MEDRGWQRPGFELEARWNRAWFPPSEMAASDLRLLQTFLSPDLQRLDFPSVHQSDFRDLDYPSFQRPDFRDLDFRDLDSPRFQRPDIRELDYPDFQRPNRQILRGPERPELHRSLSPRQPCPPFDPQPLFQPLAGDARFQQPSSPFRQRHRPFNRGEFAENNLEPRNSPPRRGILWNGPAHLNGPLPRGGTYTSPSKQFSPPQWKRAVRPRSSRGPNGNCLTPPRPSKPSPTERPNCHTPSKPKPLFPQSKNSKREKSDASANGENFPADAASSTVGLRHSGGGSSQRDQDGEPNGPAIKKEPGLETSDVENVLALKVSQGAKKRNQPESPLIPQLRELYLQQSCTETGNQPVDPKTRSKSGGSQNARKAVDPKSTSPQEGSQNARKVVDPKSTSPQEGSQNHARKGNQPNPSLVSEVHKDTQEHNHSVDVNPTSTSEVSKRKRKEKHPVDTKPSSTSVGFKNSVEGKLPGDPNSHPVNPNSILIPGGSQNTRKENQLFEEKSSSISKENQNTRERKASSTSEVAKDTKELNQTGGTNPSLTSEVSLTTREGEAGSASIVSEVKKLLCETVGLKSYSLFPTLEDQNQDEAGECEKSMSSLTEEVLPPFTESVLADHMPEAEWEHPHSGAGSRQVAEADRCVAGAPTGCRHTLYACSCAPVSTVGDRTSAAKTECEASHKSSGGQLRSMSAKAKKTLQDTYLMRLMRLIFDNPSITKDIESLFSSFRGDANVKEEQRPMQKAEATSKVKHPSNPTTGHLGQQTNNRSKEGHQIETIIGRSQKMAGDSKPIGSLQCGYVGSAPPADYSLQPPPAAWSSFHEQQGYAKSLIDVGARCKTSQYTEQLSSAEFQGERSENCTGAPSYKDIPLFYGQDLFYGNTAAVGVTYTASVSTTGVNQSNLVYIPTASGLHCDQGVDVRAPDPLYSATTDACGGGHAACLACGKTCPSAVMEEHFLQHTHFPVDDRLYRAAETVVSRHCGDGIGDGPQPPHWKSDDQCWLLDRYSGAGKAKHCREDDVLDSLSVRRTNRDSRSPSRDRCRCEESEKCCRSCGSQSSGRKDRDSPIFRRRNRDSSTSRRGSLDGLSPRRKSRHLLRVNSESPSPRSKNRDSSRSLGRRSHDSPSFSRRNFDSPPSSRRKVRDFSFSSRRKPDSPFVRHRNRVLVSPRCKTRYSLSSLRGKWGTIEPEKSRGHEDSDSSGFETVSSCSLDLEEEEERKSVTRKRSHLRQSPSFPEDREHTHIDKSNSSHQQSDGHDSSSSDTHLSSPVKKSEGKCPSKYDKKPSSAKVEKSGNQIKKGSIALKAMKVHGKKRKISRKGKDISTVNENSFPTEQASLGGPGNQDSTRLAFGLFETPELQDDEPERSAEDLLGSLLTRDLPPSPQAEPRPSKPMSDVDVGARDEKEVILPVGDSGEWLTMAANAESNSKEETSVTPKAAFSVEKEKSLTPKVVTNADKEKTFSSNVATNAQKQKSITPKVATNAQKQKSITPKVASIAEKQKSVTPKVASNAEKQKSVTPKVASNAEKQKSITPKLATNAEKQTSVTPKVASNAEKQKSITPKLATNAEKQTSVTPKVASNAEKQKSVTPKVASNAEKQKSVTPKVATNAEKQKSVTPKVASNAEKQKSVTPKVATNAEKQTSVTPKVASVAEKEKTVTPKVASSSNKEKAEKDKSFSSKVASSSRKEKSVTPKVASITKKEKSKSEKEKSVTSKVASSSSKEKSVTPKVASSSNKEKLVIPKVDPNTTSRETVLPSVSSNSFTASGECLKEKSVTASAKSTQEKTVMPEDHTKVKQTKTLVTPSDESSSKSGKPETPSFESKAKKRKLVMPDADAPKSYPKKDKAVKPNTDSNINKEKSKPTNASDSLSSGVKVVPKTNICKGLSPDAGLDNELAVVHNVSASTEKDKALEPNVHFSTNTGRSMKTSVDSDIKKKKSVKPSAEPNTYQTKEGLAEVTISQCSEMGTDRSRAAEPNVDSSIRNKTAETPNVVPNGQQNVNFNTDKRKAVETNEDSNMAKKKQPVETSAESDNDTRQEDLAEWTYSPGSEEVVHSSRSEILWREICGFPFEILDHVAQRSDGEAYYDGQYKVLASGQRFKVQHQPGCSPPINARPGFSPPINDVRTGCSPPINVRPSYSPPINVRPSYSPPINVRPSYSPPINVRPSYSPPINDVRPSYSPPINVRPSYSPPINDGRPSYSPPINVRPSCSPPINDVRPSYSPPINFRPSCSPPISVRPSCSQPINDVRSSYAPPINVRPSCSPPINDADVCRQREGRSPACSGADCSNPGMDCSIPEMDCSKSSDPASRAPMQSCEQDPLAGRAQLQPLVRSPPLKRLYSQMSRSDSPGGHPDNPDRLCGPAEERRRSCGVSDVIHAKDVATLSEKLKTSLKRCKPRGAQPDESPANRSSKETPSEQDETGVRPPKQPKLILSLSKEKTKGVSSSSQKHKSCPSYMIKSNSSMEQTKAPSTSSQRPASSSSEKPTTSTSTQQLSLPQKGASDSSHEGRTSHVHNGDSKDKTHHSKDKTHHSQDSKDKTHHSNDKTHHSKDSTDKTHHSNDKTHHSKDSNDKTHHSKDSNDKTHHSKDSKDKTPHSKDKTHHSKDSTEKRHLSKDSKDKTHNSKDSKDKTHLSKDSNDKTHNSKDSKDKTHHSKDSKDKTQRPDNRDLPDCGKGDISTSCGASERSSKNSEDLLIFCESCMTIFTCRNIYKRHPCLQAKDSSDSDTDNDDLETDQDPTKSGAIDDNADGPHAASHQDPGCSKAGDNTDVSTDQAVDSKGCDRPDSIHRGSRKRPASKTKASRRTGRGKNGPGPSGGKKPKISNHKSGKKPRASRKEEVKPGDTFVCSRCDQVFFSRGGLLFHWKHIHKNILKK